jgi:hypothetical protein
MVVGRALGPNHPSPNHLVTQNTAMGNQGPDFSIECLGDVTFNISSEGFPASYLLSGAPACHTANNN